MDRTTTAPASFGAELRAGVAATLPLMVGVVPFGLLLGTLAAQKGLSPLEVMLMSGLVFAGSSQFVAVELWQDPAPVLLLALMALMVNSRHLLMGATLVPHWRGVPSGKAALALYFLTDEGWALSLARAAQGPLTLAFYTGIAATLGLSWVFWTGLGAVLGTAVGDPARFGLDFAFVAVFLALLRGFWRGRSTLWPWLASAVVSALVYRLVPGPWYVAAGALAGLVVAVVRADAAREAAA